MLKLEKMKKKGVSRWLGRLEADLVSMADMVGVEVCTYYEPT
jgi:hypothetical protein